MPPDVGAEVEALSPIEVTTGCFDRTLLLPLIFPFQSFVSVT